MNQNGNQSEIINKDLEKSHAKELRRFFVVMIAFVIGMACLLFYEVSAWWIWYIYFVIWTVVELRIAKNIKLKWWYWLIIIAIIIAIDFLVLELIEYLKN